MHHTYTNHLGCCSHPFTPPPCNCHLLCSTTFLPFLTEVREGPWQCLPEMLLWPGQCPRSTEPFSHSWGQKDLGSDPGPMTSYGRWHLGNHYTLSFRCPPLWDGGHRNRYGTRWLCFDRPKALGSRFQVFISLIGQGYPGKPEGASLGSALWDPQPCPPKCWSLQWKKGHVQGCESIAILSNWKAHQRIV